MEDQISCIHIELIDSTGSKYIIFIYDIYCCFEKLESHLKQLMQTGFEPTPICTAGCYRRATLSTNPKVIQLKTFINRTTIHYNTKYKQNKDNTNLVR